MISNSDDVIDSRDVLQRIEELRELREGGLGVPWAGSDEAGELIILEDLARQGENDAEDWDYGALLIRESYFTEYATQLAVETTEDRDIYQKWPFNHIDWEAAADHLAETDYSEVTFDGVTYYVR